MSTLERNYHHVNFVRTLKAFSKPEFIDSWQWEKNWIENSARERTVRVLTLSSLIVLADRSMLISFLASRWRRKEFIIVFISSLSLSTSLALSPPQSPPTCVIKILNFQFPPRIFSQEASTSSWLECYFPMCRGRRALLVFFSAACHCWSVADGGTVSCIKYFQSILMFSSLFIAEWNCSCSKIDDEGEVYILHRDVVFPPTAFLIFDLNAKNNHQPWRWEAPCAGEKIKFNYDS